MSRQYNEWYFRNENQRGGFDIAWDEWNSKCESREGIHRLIFGWTTPFNYAGASNSYDCGASFQFMPERSTVFMRAEKAAKRAEKRRQKEMYRERLDHEINRLLNACAPFPQLKTSN